MKWWLRKQLRFLLGIADDFAYLESRITSVSQSVHRDMMEINQNIVALRSDLATTFSTSEFDLKRKQMSNELGSAVMKRLAAEQSVRDKYGYTPQDPEAE